jgi:hypothetical protein
MKVSKLDFFKKVFVHINMNEQLLLLFFVIGFLVLCIILYCFMKKEKFDIPLRSSSAWDWNLGPGYGAGYGTGYAMWGIWPANLPKEPWKNWMWGRRPLIFKTPFTPMPQIDYNNAPDMSKPVSNYYISILQKNDMPVLSVNGFPNKTLQLDRNRPYFFHVYAPGAEFILTNDGETSLINPISQGTFAYTFNDDEPDVLYYMMKGKPETGGVIYLNNTRWL